MAPRCSRSSFTLAPFLYPPLFASRSTHFLCAALNRGAPSQARASSTSNTINELPESRLNPAPDDYASPNFADKAELTLYAGRGGNGCVSFLREAFIPDGPPNGGDGGNGGNVYIQAAHGETSLHKIARRQFARAGRGRHGQGSARGGTRGEDVVITVPVGTIVRELERHDPVAEEDMNLKLWKEAEKGRKREQRLAEMEKEERRRAFESAEVEDGEEEDEEALRYSRQTELGRQLEKTEEDSEIQDPRRDKWLLYPGMSKGDMNGEAFPRPPKRQRPLHQPPAPIHLDLSKPTEHPILLATGGVGGLGNPHFTSRAHPRPIFATKGDEAVTMRIELELKLLADVGLVGLPNAGKSTLLRALTNSRTRVGNWAFTTLQPNIGTVVLDKYSGRPTVAPSQRTPGTHPADPRTRFTVADIPGLIEGAHLDRGLGIAFLRHVERAGVLAFVIDMAAGNAVKALDALWREVGLYAEMREDDDRDRDAASRIDWSLAPDSEGQGPSYSLNADLPPGENSAAQHIAGKPWFVVATKADLPETQQNFRELKAYLERITHGVAPHPSGVEGAWVHKCAAIPVSAINGQGVDRIVHWAVGLLDE